MQSEEMIYFPYTSVRDPQWADVEHTRIDCVVKFAHINSEVPFTACPQDSTRHGQEIYYRAVRGEFGSVKEYVPLSVPKRKSRIVEHLRAEWQFWIVAVIGAISAIAAVLAIV